MNKTSKVLYFALFAVFVTLKFYIPIEIEDIWWHLSTGRWIFEHHRFPTTDVFNLLDTNRPWILTQSFGSCIFYAAYLIGEFEGLKIFRLLTFAIIIFIYFRNARKNIPFELSALLLIIFSMILIHRVQLRPFIFNFILIQIYLTLLFKHWHNKQTRAVFIIPALSILWINLHLGGFVYGTALLGLFLINYVIESIQLKKFTAQLKHLIIILTAHLTALLMTPYGLKGALYPFIAIFNPDFIVNKYLTSNIIELLPPAFLITLRGFWFHLLIILTILCAIKNKRFKFLHILLLGFSFFFFLYTRRAVIFFTLSFSYVIFDTFMGSHYLNKIHSFTKKKYINYIVHSLFIIFLCANIIHNANAKVYINNQLVHEKSLTFDPYTPIKNFDLLKDNRVSGNIYNWDGYGGYLIWNGYPQIKPFVDGRQADPEAYLDHLLIKSDPQKYWNFMEKKYGFTIALINVNFGNQYKVLKLLMDNPDWKLISAEGSSFLLVKTNILNADNIIQNTTFPYKPGLPDQLMANNPSWPTYKNNKIYRYLFNTITYNQDLEQGTALYTQGFEAEGLRLLYKNQNQIFDPRVDRMIQLMHQDIHSKGK